MKHKGTAWYEIIRSLNGLYSGSVDGFEYGALLRDYDPEQNYPFGPDDYDPDVLAREERGRRDINPLVCIKIFPGEEGRPHWHYVSMGFSDLYSDNVPHARGESGYGFELTARLARGDEETPPLWPINEMGDMARYVFSTGIRFREYENFHLHRRTRTQNGFNLEATAFVADPQFKVLETETGKVQLLQMCFLTADEYAALRSWKASKFVEAVARFNPLFIADPHQKSILETPEAKRVIEDGIASDGSSLGLQYANMLQVQTLPDKFIITMSAEVVEAVLIAMRGRIPFGRHFVLNDTNDCTVKFMPNESDSVSFDDQGQLVIGLSGPAAVELSQQFKPCAGKYRFNSLPNLEIVVTRFEVKDDAGNVVETVG
jgi:hypothetical protein